MTGKLSDFDWLLQCQRLLSQLLRKRPTAALKAGKNTLAVRKVRGGWLTGRPQYATACLNLLNQTSRQQQQRAKLGHIYRWEKKSAHIINKVLGICFTLCSIRPALCQRNRLVVTVWEYILAQIRPLIPDVELHLNAYMATSSELAPL